MRDTSAASKKLSALNMNFDVVITSTLIRAIQSARLLVDDNIPIIQSRLCNERNYGKMQGSTEDEVKLIRPKIVYISAGGVNHSVDPPEGESFETLRERAQQFHQFLFKEYQGLSILVVSHGVFLQQFHGLIQGKSCIESLATYVPNLELTCFHFEGSRLVYESRIMLSNRRQDSW